MTGAVHLALVQKVRKQLAPHLKEVIGSWLCAQYDPNREVAKLAVDSFQVMTWIIHWDLVHMGSVSYDYDRRHFQTNGQTYFSSVTPRYSSLLRKTYYTSRQRQ